MSTPTSTIPVPTPATASTEPAGAAPIAAFGGIRRVPQPINDPNRTYAPGSPERAELKARLKHDGGREAGHPARHRREGDAHRPHRAGGDAARSPARARRLSPGGARARPAGDRRCRRGAARVGKLALGRPCRRVAARRRIAGDHVALDDQCGNDAGAVEDRVPGGDRRRLGDDRLLALQRLLRAGALRRAANQRSGRLEPDGIPPARRVRLRDLALQLHRDRRQPDDRPGADGQHRRSGSPPPARC